MTTNDWAATTPGLRRQILPWGYCAAFGACVLNGVWLACFIFLQGLGDVAVQTQTHPAVFRVSVGAALLLTIVQAPILLALVLLAFERFPARAAIGGVLYALYIPVNLIAYYLFGRLAPVVHAPALATDGVARSIATTIEIGQPLALTGALPVLGYGLLGLAWCLLSSALASRDRLWKVAARLLFTSGLLSGLGAIGGFTDVSWLATGCLLGGVVSLPALAVLGIALWRTNPPEGSAQ